MLPVFSSIWFLIYTPNDAPRLDEPTCFFQSSGGSSNLKSSFFKKSSILRLLKPVPRIILIRISKTLSLFSFSYFTPLAEMLGECDVVSERMMVVRTKRFFPNRFFLFKRKRRKQCICRLDTKKEDNRHASLLAF